MSQDADPHPSSTQGLPDNFSKGQPITDPGHFIGRGDQVRRLIDCLAGTAQGKPQHTIISGERGLGKSSLVTQARLLAEGENRLVDRLGLTDRVPGADHRFDMVTVLHTTNSTEQATELVGALVRPFRLPGAGLFGAWKIKVDLKIFYAEKGDRSKVDRAITSLADLTIKRLRRATRKSPGGVVLFVDEVDRLPEASAVGSYFKVVTERLARAGVARVVFVLAGVTGVVEALGKDHPSVANLFDNIPLHRLTDHETKEILEDGFAPLGAEADPDVVEAVHDKAGGFPYPVHLLGRTLLEVAADPSSIAIEDFKHAVTRIIETRRYEALRRQVGVASGEDERAVLAAIAHQGTGQLLADELPGAASLPAETCDLCVRALAEKEVLRSPLAHGVVELQDPFVTDYVDRFGL